MHPGAPCNVHILDRQCLGQLRRNHPLRASVLASVAGDLMTIEVHYSLLLDLCDLKTSPFRE